MTRVLSVIVSILFIANTADAKDGKGKAVKGLKVPKHAAKVGQVESTTAETTMELHVTYNKAQQFDITMTQERADDAEALVVSDDGVVTKERVSYSKRTETMQGIGGGSNNTDLGGKSYLVERKGTDLDVTMTDGSAAPAAEVSLVKRDVTDVGKPDLWNEILSGPTYQVGTSVKVGGDALARLFEDSNSKLKSADTSLTLKSIENGIATFQLDGTLSSADPSFSMGFEIHGLITVEASTGVVTGFSIEGPITMDGQMKGTGFVKMKATISVK
jgi:hypothetical protein